MSSHDSDKDGRDDATRPAVAMCVGIDVAKAELVTATGKRWTGEHYALLRAAGRPKKLALVARMR
jgi:hypothetical protein